jgi:nicotinamidase-related amidase
MRPMTIAPTHDEDSTPYPIYDMYDDVGMIVPELCMEMTKGAELVDEILYEDDSPHESHHARYHLVSQLVPCVTTHAMLMK